MVNPHRLRFVRQYAAKLFSREGFAKVARDPTSVWRTVKTFVANRNLRVVPTGELLNDCEDTINGFATLAGSVSIKLPANLERSAEDQDTADLGRILKDHGSDKSTSHDYFEVYGAILRDKRALPLDILEIGLGTNNLAFQSNMGLGGRPGASQRAFRDWAPAARIVGADVDRGVLFQEDRIETCFVDQTDPATLSALAERFGDRSFDLIIDDGLHLPHANLNVLNALLPLLAEDGVFVVEDIEAEHLHYWGIAAKLLEPIYESFLVQRRGGALFLVRRRT